MESLQHIKNRLGAVGNVGKITKAMEVVAATKMRKAQEIALASRPYALAALKILHDITRDTSLQTPLAEVRKVKKTLVVVVSSDRGFAGSFNAHVFRVAEPLISAPGSIVLAVGKKAHQFAEKKGYKIAESFSGFGDFVHYEEIAHVADLIINGFKDGRWDRVLTVSMHFHTTLKQETLIRQILPTDYEKIQETVKEIIPKHGRYSNVSKNGAGDGVSIRTEYIFEPSPEIALSVLVPYLVRLQIYHLVLEANASEHSARMVAMKTASDNADELSGFLRLLYNKARQAGITKEIIEIISTQNAL